MLHSTSTSMTRRILVNLALPRYSPPHPINQTELSRLAELSRVSGAQATSGSLPPIVTVNTERPRGRVLWKRVVCRVLRAVGLNSCFGKRPGVERCSPHEPPCRRRSLQVARCTHAQVEPSEHSGFASGGRAARVDAAWTSGTSCCCSLPKTPRARTTAAGTFFNTAASMTRHGDRARRMRTLASLMPLGTLLGAGCSHGSVLHAAATHYTQTALLCAHFGP